MSETTHLKIIFIVTLVSILSLPCFFSARAEPLTKSNGGEFSLKEKLWAAKWINEKLSLLMEDGLIKRIKCSKGNGRYEVFVSSSWHLLGTEEKRDFLANLSLAREITRHSPYLFIKDNDSGAVVAQVNEWGILIFGEEGEEKSSGTFPQMEYGNNGIVE
jgi:hypothetical protein